MEDRELNITSGTYFNEHIRREREGIFVPFREALLDGELLLPLFDLPFAEKRAAVHGITADAYLSDMAIFFTPDTIKRYPSVCLWFGRDAFCQINLLALLAYLEQISYKGRVLYQEIDDETLTLVGERTPVALGKFYASYRELSEGNKISTSFPLLDHGIEDYLYVKSKDNRFYRYIKEHLGKTPRGQLVMELLGDSADYGLSDTYIEKMIDEATSADAQAPYQKTSPYHDSSRTNG